MQEMFLRGLLRNLDCSPLHICIIIAVPVFALWGMETKTVDEFCKNDFNALPFNFGEYFKKNPDMSATKLDILLNGPSKIMCSKACPCAPIDKTKWSMKW